MRDAVKRLRWMVLLVAVVALPGCLAAAAAAGAGGAIAWSDRGAKSMVNGTVDQVHGRALAVFSSMGIARNQGDTDSGGTERTLRGTRGDTEVTVEIERETDSTVEVEVYARKNEVNYEKSLARDVLQRIMSGR